LFIHGRQIGLKSRDIFADSSMAVLASRSASVALTVGLMELTARTRAMQELTFQVFEAFAAATVIYLLVNLVVVQGMRRLERRVAVPGLIAGGTAGGH
jgi:glutamate/aspartate transport system permease protein